MTTTITHNSNTYAIPATVTHEGKSYRVIEKQDFIDRYTNDEWREYHTFIGDLCEGDLGNGVSFVVRIHDISRSRLGRRKLVYVYEVFTYNEHGEFTFIG